MSKNKVNKKTLYFLIAVTVLGILPLLLKNITKSKTNNVSTSNASVNSSSTTSIEKKVNKLNQLIGSFGKATNPWPKKQGSAKDMLDEIINLKRDPFLITKHLAESLSIPDETDSEGNQENSGQLSVENEKQKKNPLDGLELKGVMIDGGTKSALINDKLCYENEEINGMKIISIKEGDVGLYKDGTTYTLRFKE